MLWPMELPGSFQRNFLRTRAKSVSTFLMFIRLKIKYSGDNECIPSAFYPVRSMEIFFMYSIVYFLA